MNQINITNVEVFKLGNQVHIRFDSLVPFPDHFDKSKTYYLIIAEAGPDPVPEFNR